jgi:hypothetical protein
MVPLSAQGNIKPHTLQYRRHAVLIARRVGTKIDQIN